MHRRRLNGPQPGLLSLWICVLGIAGCGEAQPEPPPSHPVQGKIVFRGGDVNSLYDQQAAILFLSVEQPEVQASGEIMKDGTFTLVSVKGAQSWPGAVPGKHRGSLYLNESIQRLVNPKFLDRAKSGIEITVPTNGEVVIEIHK
jgi:hypothetical protein